MQETGLLGTRNEGVSARLCWIMDTVIGLGTVWDSAGMLASLIIAGVRAAPVQAAWRMPGSKGLGLCARHPHVSFGLCDTGGVGSGGSPLVVMVGAREGATYVIQ